ncbi:MAG: glycerophosphodiester phosphodiesterase family protein [Rhodospirillaceae bacterium]
MLIRNTIIVAALIAATSVSAQRPNDKFPLIIGHRGASGSLPDHTIEAYELAVAQGADYIEPDFVASKDGYLFARHENELSQTTNVAEVFPDKKTKKVIEGKTVEGWFSEDLTHDEIKKLRARQPFKFRDQSHNDKYDIPTLAEVLALRASLSREHKRRIGVFPELKHADYYRAMNYPVEGWTVQILEAWALDRAGSPVIVQSFDKASVEKLNGMMPHIPAVQLLTEEADVSDAALAAIKKYADGIGPPKSLIVPVKNGQTGKPTDLIQRAHKIGLAVYPYTFRPEKQFLPASYGGDPAKEYCLFATLGADGLFTDTPDRALKAFHESCPMPR